MKRILFSLLVLFLLLDLAACSKDGGKEELTEIDAVKVSEQIVPLKYAVEIPEQSGAVWIDEPLLCPGTGSIIPAATVKALISLPMTPRAPSAR